MDDQALTEALAQKLKDPHQFGKLLEAAAQLAGGVVSDLTASYTQRPTKVMSCGLIAPSNKEYVVGWQYDVEIKFRAHSGVA